MISLTLDSQFGAWWNFVAFLLDSLMVSLLPKICPRCGGAIETYTYGKAKQVCMHGSGLCDYSNNKN